MRQNTSRSLPAAVLRPLRDVNAFESTVEQLAAAIRLGVFSAGEQLPPERDLAAQLGVSRVNLRGAIAALRAANMVQTRRGRGGGTIVMSVGSHQTQPDGPTLRRRGPQLADALNFRRVVEPGSAYLAATQDLSSDQRAWLVTSETEVRSATDDAARRIADSRLHLAIATVSGSSMLIEAVTRAQSALHDMLTAIPVLARNIEHSHIQHQAIVAAVLAGDAHTARDVSEQHCDATSALLRGLLGLT
jgi:GntR family transcriptional repressor for pyruvate dehydrogenase complex